VLHVPSAFGGRGDRKSAYVQAHRAHQRERIARLDDTVPQAIVEMQDTILEAILEVHIGGCAAKAEDEIGEREVVGRHQADGVQVDQAGDDRLGADAAIV
jgi:hypothetical protein